MSRLNIFQRFSQKENTVTNNILLLFSRLYENSPSIYNEFFSQLFEDENLYSINPSFNQQLSKGGKGIIDGQIKTKSSSIVIETKRSGLEDVKKLLKYTDRFKNEDAKILLHLSRDVYKEKQLNEIKESREIKEKKIKFFSITYQQTSNSLEALAISHPYNKELLVLNEHFREYCQLEELFSKKEFLLRAVTCGPSRELNKEFNFYFDPASRSYTPHKYIGIYYEKAVHFIGKIDKVVEADLINEKLVIHSPKTQLSKQEQLNLKNGMVKAIEQGWDIEKNHKFFLVKKLYKTNFKKTTPYGIFSNKFFDLRNYVDLNPLPEVEKIAKILDGKSWYDDVITKP